MNSMKHTRIIASIALVFFLLGCAGHSAQEEKESLPTIKSSPLGIDQPDPEFLARSAIGRYRKGDIWGFLSHFGFLNETTNEYFTPVREKSDPFYGVTMDELRSLAQTLFPLINSKGSHITYGKPKTVRNRPLTVNVPFTVTYDFSSLVEAEKKAILYEVNTALASQGQPHITFSQYVEKIQSMPSESHHRFIYRQRKWYIDGANWRPYRAKQ